MTVSGDKTVKIWSVEGTELSTLKAHRSTVRTIAYSPDGSYFISAGSDRIIRMWKPTHDLKTTVNAHSAAVFGIAISPDSSTIATASLDYTVKLWQREAIALPRRGNRPTALLFETLRGFHARRAVQASYGRRGPSVRDAFSPSAVTARATRTGNRSELVTEEDEWLFRVQQEYQTFTENTEVENNLKAPATQRKPTIPSDCLPLDSPLYINRPPIAELTHTEISQPGFLIRIKTPKLQGKNSLLSRILNRATGNGYKTVNLDFREANVTVSAGLHQFLR